MRIFPSVDLLDGKAVRLLYGDRGRVTDYGDPVAVVRGYVRAGAEIVHVVDLNGAFDGTETNDAILSEIAKLPIATQLGGGIRSRARAEKVLAELGFDRAVLGSATVTDPELVRSLAAEFGNRIVGCLDTKDGEVAIRGWREKSGVSPFALAEKLSDFGVRDLVFTDVSRDGALSGVNAELTAELQNRSGLNVIASGGVKDFADLETLASLGVYGAILGRSLYAGAVDLPAAILAFSEKTAIRTFSDQKED